MPTIDSLFDARFQTFAGTALRQKVGGAWQELSYRELWEKSGCIAAGLVARKLAPGERVALLAPSSMRWVATFFGIVRAGCVVVPIDKDLKAAELRHILADCGARVIFTAGSSLDTLLDCLESLTDLDSVVLLEEPEESSPLGMLWASLREEWDRVLHNGTVPPAEAERIEGLETQFQEALLQDELGKASEATPAHPFLASGGFNEKLAKEGKLLPLRSLLRNTPVTTAPRTDSDTAVILYTSGTTGRSKGAMLSHGNIISNIEAVSAHFGLDQTIHTLSYLPINHVFELVAGVLLPLYMGGRVSFAESIKKLGDNLAEVQPTFLLGVPAVYKMILERIRKNVQAKAVSRLMFAVPLGRRLVKRKVQQAFGAGTIFVSGGAALDPAIAAGLMEFGIPIYQGYGITETSPVISAEQPGRMRLGTVGRVISEVEVKIDAPNEEEIGEILVRGPNVMLGYFNNRDATNDVLRDGWYHTGDLGAIDADGYLRICGRVKNLIVTPNGKNVYPEEVENELLKSPFIAEVMVYGHKIEPMAEEVRAEIFPNQDELDAYAQKHGKGRLTLKDVEELLKGEVQTAGKGLADYKRVKRFTIREEEFPKTATRKIKRYIVNAGIATNH
ncbi:AMP-dependent synthetase/ligase [Geomesophilobacter sediminis]|uniref:AMP-binding protein n=1 Tax=Geomesophilobacter sediminis TaxID=2798584 RepID=A0A8J7IRZ1_9BACT|nr:AMP-binding protein [Geomesophilobacter sediminis]MBJ6725899.1 AMP-binding protein [Geomesophilobacter sediminis]